MIYSCILALLILANPISNTNKLLPDGHHIVKELILIMLFCFLGGFYSQIVKPNLRLISLNTILYYSPNHATENMTDPAGQFEWLEGTLDTSQQANEKVKLWIQYLFQNRVPNILYWDHFCD